MVTLAFMQNLWVRDPAKVKAMIDRHGEEFRRRAIKYALFAGCVSGRRLKQAFGPLCDEIVWDEITREIGGAANACFPPDFDHMVAVIKTVRPRIVLTFGVRARDAVCLVQENSDALKDCKFVRAMHPAARHLLNLNEAARQLRESW